MESLIQALQGWRWPALIALIPGVVAGVAATFEWLDKGVSDTGRLALSNKLKSFPSDESIDSWATVFPTLIDRVFGEKPASLNFFIRSSWASTLAVLSVGIVYCLVNHERLSLLGLFNFFAFFANWLPDYLSLLVSRVIVRIMAKRTSARDVWLLLMADTAITALIAVLSSFVALLVFEANIYSETFTWARHTLGPMSFRFEVYLIRHIAWHAVGRAFLRMRAWDWLTLRAHTGASIFFYSAFFTSVWVWLYVLSLFLISLLHRTRSIWMWIAPYLDIEKAPMVAIGRVAGILAGVGYSVLLGIIWLSRHWL
jgi:hypothetical protein